MITKFLFGWKGYAAATLLSGLVAGVGGWQARAVLADRDLSILQSQYDNYKSKVAIDTAKANERSLSELARLTQLYNQLQEQAQEERLQRIQTSQRLTQSLRELENHDPAPADAIGNPLREYLDSLREHQLRARSSN